ncbi:MAG: hypothetical protein GY803_31960 [Chloroflexi bacterium]|nr:hypothetical protein [Chloroflexota bacterium]
MEQAKTFSWINLTAAVFSVALFILPIGYMYNAKLISAAFIVTLLFLLGAAGLYAVGRFSLPSKRGFAAIILGATIWEVGWAMMVLIDKQVGWGIFVVGWLILSLGLFLLGVNNIQRSFMSRWHIMPLILGFCPALAEIANPYFFTGIPPWAQIALMILYSLGWILSGQALALISDEKPREAILTAPAHIQPQVHPAHGTD